MSDVLKYKQSQANATLRKVFFTAVNNTDVTDFLQASDMSTFTVKISKNGATPASPSSSTCTEVGSTDQKGVWFWAPNATDFDTPGRLVVVITNPSGSKVMRKRVINLLVGPEDGSDTATSNITQVSGTAIGTPTTAGYLRTDVHAMEAGVLTATAIAAGALSIAKFAADMLLGGFGILDSGTCQAGSTSTTLKLRAGASAADGAYGNAVCVLTGGTGALQVGQVSGTGYVGATKVATMAASWPVTPDGSTTYTIFASGASGTGADVASIAAAVWAKVLVGSATAGDLMRLGMAIEAGPVTDFTTGTLVYKCPITSKTRATVTTDATGRLTVTLGDLT